MRVGLDIGGTKTAAVVLDEHGSILDELVRPTGYGADSVIKSAVLAITELADRAGIASSEFMSIGVGIPGVVQPGTGRVSHAVNLGLHDLDLGPVLFRELGVEVQVENDVNAATLGVYHFRQQADTHSMAYLNLGTGLAAGLVLDGRLWRGARGTAGEIGHIPVDPRGPVCSCGQQGCLELMASGSAITRLWPNDHPRPIEALFEAADRGDQRAMDVRIALLENIAAAVRVLVLTIDVQSVVIGGGASGLGRPLIDAVTAVLARWADDSPFLHSLDLPQRVELLDSALPAAAVGAALVGSAVADRA